VGTRAEGYAGPRTEERVPPPRVALGLVGLALALAVVSMSTGWAVASYAGHHDQTFNWLQADAFIAVEVLGLSAIVGTLFSHPTAVGALVGLVLLSVIGFVGQAAAYLEIDSLAVAAGESPRFRLGFYLGWGALFFIAAAAVALRRYRRL
jgi:hypothetical protein